MSASTLIAVACLVPAGGESTRGFAETSLEGWGARMGELASAARGGARAFQRSRAFSSAPLGRRAFARGVRLSVRAALALPSAGSLSPLVAGAAVGVAAWFGSRLLDVRDPAAEPR